MCKEFTITPLEALEQPFGTIQRILSVRAFVEARAEMEAAGDERELEITPAIRAVTIAQMRIRGLDVSWNEL